MNEITRRGLTTIAEEMNCISKSSHNIAGTLAALIGAEDALHYADSGNTNNQDIFCFGNVQGMIIADKSLIEEAKAMILQMKIEGSVRVRSNGLLEFRTRFLVLSTDAALKSCKKNLIKKSGNKKAVLNNRLKKTYVRNFPNFILKHIFLIKSKPNAQKILSTDIKRITITLYRIISIKD